MDLDDGLSAAEVEAASTRIARDLRARIPQVREVFLDATATADPYRSLRPPT